MRLERFREVRKIDCSQNRQVFAKSTVRKTIIRTKMPYGSRPMKERSEALIHSLSHKIEMHRQEHSVEANKEREREKHSET
jgi:hypothetical protein